MGIGLSVLAPATSVAMAVRHATGVSAQLAPDRGAPSATGVADVLAAAPIVGALFSLAFSLLIAAGAAICALLAGRGRETARIMLAALAGVVAIYLLWVSTIGAGGGIPAGSFRSGGSVPVRVSAFRTWEYVSLGLDAVLGVLALVTCVFLLIPATGRYFRAGPGRQFTAQG